MKKLLFIVFALLGSVMVGFSQPGDPGTDPDTGCGPGSCSAAFNGSAATVTIGFDGSKFFATSNVAMAANFTLKMYAYTYSDINATVDVTPRTPWAADEEACVVISQGNTYGETYISTAVNCTNAKKWNIWSFWIELNTVEFGTQSGTPYQLTVWTGCNGYQNMGDGGQYVTVVWPTAMRDGFENPNCCPAYGTYVSQSCGTGNYVLYTRADGNCGTYQELSTTEMCE